MDLQVPNLGEGIESATVVRILVAAGAAVADGQDLIEVETEKASMPIQASAGGTVSELLVKAGDTIRVGQVYARLTGAAAPVPTAAVKVEAPVPAVAAAPAVSPKPVPPTPAPPMSPIAAPSRNGESRPPVPAGPATRRLARELGIDLHHVTGTARGGRVTVEDIKAFVRTLSKTGGHTAAAGSAVSIPPMPDFSKYGPIEKKPFSQLRKAIARNLTISWNVAPQVTQHDVADITDLESSRKRFVDAAPKGAPKVTMTVLAIKACVAALKQFPHFNSSYDAGSGETGELILKKYFHIGIAVDTERGLVVPVIRDADKKGVRELAKELNDLAEKARTAKLTPDEMRGGTFTITNLGGIGGTAFSPILNYPEVAILGLSRSAWQPVVRDGQIVTRLMLPLSLTYDHRVIDGADGARFTAWVAAILSDPARLLFES
jgi:pyruvate dehydrogenase E2 component (dihydrolipoamide acetyltransferase)